MTRSRLPRLVALATTTLATALMLVAGPASAPSAHAVITPGAGPVSVSVLVPITVDVDGIGLLDADQLTAATSLTGALTLQLDAVTGTSAVLGIDPMLLVSIRVLGTSAPPAAVAWLARLEALPNETFLLSYADADPVEAARVDAVDVLTPLGFDYAVDPADFGPAATPAPTPVPTGGTDPDGGSSATPTPTPTSTVVAGPPPLPTLADLMAWTTTLDAIAWPADETHLDADVVARLAAAGFADVVVPSTALARSPQALVGLDGIDAIATDADLTDLVRRATSAPAVTQTAVLGELAAALDAAATASPGRTMVASLARGWWIGPADPATTLSTIEGSASAQLVPLAQILEGPVIDGGIADADGDQVAAAASASEQTTQLVLAERAEQRYLTIAATPLVVEQPRRLALLALLGAGWADQRSSWAVATAGFLTDSAAIRSSVQIVESTDVFLPGDSADLRIAVSNALPVAVTVYVTVTPLRPLLHVPDTMIPVTIDPDSTNRAKVPVQAIANGDVTVRTMLTAADTSPVGGTQYTKIVVQAGWETAGAIVVSVLVVAVFGGGIVRNVLKRRRSRRTAAAGE